MMDRTRTRKQLIVELTALRQRMTELEALESGRKRAEEALQESERRFRLIAETIDEVLWMADIRIEKMVYISPGYERVWGRSRESLYENPGSFLDAIHPEDRERVVAVLEFKKIGQPFGLEYRIIRPDGSIRWIWDRGFPVRDEAGHATLYLGIAQDITESRRAAKELQKSKETAERSAKESAIIAEIGRIIGSTLDVAEVYKAFSQKVKELIPFDRITINLVNLEEGVHTVPYAEGTYVSGRQPGSLVPLSGTTVEKVVRTRKGIVLRMEDEREVAAEFPGLLPDFQAGMRSGLTVPLISSDRVIGGWALRSIRPGIYTEDDLRLAENVSNQIAGAIANAQLYAERRQAEDALRNSEEEANRLARENAILAEIGQIISSTLNIDEVYPLFSAKVKTLLPYDRIVINLISKNGVALTNRYVQGDPTPQRNAGDIYSMGGTLTEIMIQDREGLIIDSQDEKEVAAKYPGLLPEFKAGSRSFLSVPLISGDKATGGLHFRSRKYRFYSEKDLKLAESIANQITGAIANAQLFDELKRAEEALRSSEEEANRLVRESAIIAEIGRIISSTLNVDEVYKRFAEKVSELIPFDRIVIGLVNREKGTASSVYVAGVDVPGRQPGDITPLQGTVILECTRTRSGLLLQPESVEECLARFPALLPSFQAGLQSMIYVPLISKDQAIGVLSVRSTKAKAYTDRDVKLAENVATQIAGAIANAQLWDERKRAEAKTETLQEQLLQAQKMEAIGTLAGGIAHDFNNILSVILGYAELASLDIEESSKAMHNLEYSMKAAHRAKDLVQHLLSFSRQGRQERKPLDIKPIVKEGLKFLRASLPATIDMRENIEEESGTVEADPTEVHQVLMNLCTNSAHAMYEKGGILEVSLTRLDIDGGTSAASQGIDPGSYVRLRVSDTGHGMPPEILKRIFDPYFTTKEVGKGTGLGLAVVHGIVKSYGGEITVSSEVGKGSAFDVYFPGSKIVEVRLEAHKIEPLPLGGHERVLFVDDEKAITEVGREVLEHLGYEVVTRTSSIEALELFRVQGERFDLVITDMTMPNMTGDKLAQELLTIHPGIPIILCTGFSEHITEERAKAIGIREFAMKPLVMKELAKTIRRALEFEKQ